MTLAELARIVTSKVGHTDEESVAVCKDFLRQRYEMVWNEALWKESVGVFFETEFATLPPTNTASAPIFDEVLLNPAIDRPLALRYVSDSKSRVLEASDLSATLFSDPGRFERIGDPVSFTITGSQASDHYRNGITLLEVFSDSVSDVGQEIRIAEDNGITGFRKRETLVLNGTSSVLTTNTYANPTMISKGATAGRVTVQVPSSSRVTDIDIARPKLVELEPHERERQHVKVKIQGQPREQFALITVGKRRFPGLREDLDSPTLSGVDNALIAYAQADMLERERQYGKAAMKVQEGGAMLDQLKRLETHQQATISRVVPATGPQYDYDLKPSIFQ